MVLLCLATTGEPKSTLKSGECDEEIIKKAEKWDMLVDSLKDSLARRRSLESVKDVFEVLSDAMHNGEILNMEF